MASPRSDYPSVFTRIIRGEIPCLKVYQDSQVIAFLDVNPIAPGHTLVVPVEQAETLDALTDESAAAVGRVLPRICRAVTTATGCRDFNVLQNNGAAAHQAVLHVHFHIIPKPSSGGGLGIAWPSRPIDREPAVALAALIAANL